MFRAFSLSRRTISLSLPFVLLWAWAACLTFCSEAASAHDEERFAASAVTIDVETGGVDSCCFENCSLVAAPAAVQERQNVSVSADSSRRAALLPFRYQAIVPKTFASDANPHAPPEIVFARFLRLKTFRI
jgi:hypothetical protein